MNTESQDRFIEAWGSMGVLWGINRSMARVHALLIVSAEPLSLDAIAGRLRISRGNASMSLKDLRAWRVARRVHLPEDRRDYYVTEPDPWTMLFRILSERRRRELEPARAAVQAALSELGRVPEEAPGEVSRRLSQMGEMLETINQTVERVLADPAASRALLSFVLPALEPKTN